MGPERPKAQSVGRFVCCKCETHGFLQELLQGVDSGPVSSLPVDNNVVAGEKEREKEQKVQRSYFELCV